MTPKQEAKELVDKFYNIIKEHYPNPKIFLFNKEINYQAKQCALIHVNGMKKVEDQILQGIPSDYVYKYEPDLDEIKQEIIKQ